VDELVVKPVCEPAELIDQPGDICCGRRGVENCSRSVNDPDLVVVPEPAFVCGIVERVACYHLLEREDEIRREVGLCNLPDLFHGLVIVEDHLLVAVFGLAPLPEHLFCHPAGGGGSFELA